MIWTIFYTRLIGLLTSVAIFVTLALIPHLGHAGSALVIEVGKFSSAQEGTALPIGWRPLTFPKIPRHTRYEIIKEGETTVVRASSEAAASGLVNAVRVDLREYPILQWRWKILNVISKGDVRTKQGDDYAARIYITFEYDPEKVDFSTKVKYRMGRLLFGDIPIAAINYIWDNRTPPGTIVDSAYTDRSKLIVVESSRDHAGQWIEEERNVYEDYKKAFGKEPPLVNGVAIMTDTDNTGEKAIAYYGDIAFKSAR
ncbi:MAG: DUF3047 domain-containing protein [Nitrospirae bacterium]|nr:DUF3047 domain-containing protein [Nitrospirota bacterium]